uniref:Uncharacterized protein n=1 Tax=Medicago truncatula TaxID=3880 RepID=I3SS69_MEDTR|nr:unknown [Medicago truncatula]
MMRVQCGSTNFRKEHSSYRTYEIVHQFIKHGFQAKIIENSTILIHCIRSHDSEFGLMDPSFKMIYLRYQHFTKLWLKHFKRIYSSGGFGHYTSKTSFCIFLNSSEKRGSKKVFTMHSIYLLMKRRIV